MVTMHEIQELEKHWHRTIGWMNADNGKHFEARHTKRVLEMLIEKYTEPHRRRHGCIHILEMLDKYQSIKGEDYIIMLAIWFHDAIWNAGSKINEENSIIFMRKCMKMMGASIFDASRVEKLILATKHDKIETDFKCMLIADLDIFCLGKSAKEFNADRKLIRKEYSMTDEHIFEIETSNFFKSFLQAKPDTIFYNKDFIEEYGKQALENIRSLIK